MRRNTYWFFLVVVAAAIQVTWLDIARVSGVLPDVMLLLVVYFALADGEERAMWTGVVGGVFQDVAANTGLGHHVVCYVIAGYAAGRVGRRLITGHPAVRAGAVLIASLIHGILYIAIAYVQDPQTGAFVPLLSVTVPTAFYTAIVTPFIFIVLDWLRLRRGSAPGSTA
jgi:rod shape-determining protein MreD